MDDENEFVNYHHHPASYACLISSVYIFNMMISSGLLVLPKAFVEVGCVLGLVGMMASGIYELLYSDIYNRESINTFFFVTN